MAYVTRQGKGSRMSISDLDGTLNYLYTASANASTSSISASYAATASYVNGFEPYNYKEIEITSAEILDIGNNDIELFPALPSGQYYEGKMIFEYTHVTTPYTMDPGDLYLSVYDFGNSEHFIHGLITQPFNKMAMIMSHSGVYYADINNGAEVSTDALNLNSPSAVTLSVSSGGSPTLGDGTILAKIWYRVRTFGTEL